MTNWLDVNAGRAYPLVSVNDPHMFYEGDDLNPISFPTSWILDAGFIMGVDAAFDPALDFLYLYSLEIDLAGGKHEGKITIKCRRNGVGTDKAFYFELLIPDLTVAAPIYIRGTAKTAGGTNANLGTCFLVLGGGITIGQFSAGLWWDEECLLKFEPCTIQSLKSGYVKTVKAANRERLHSLIGAAQESSSSSSPEPSEIKTCYSYPNGAFVGDIKIEPGYNCSVEVNRANNYITIGARLGAGAGTPCYIENEVYYGEIPITQDEITQVSNNEILSGGPKCEEVICTINGCKANDNGTFQLIGNAGVTIVPDPVNHKLIIKLGCSKMLLGCGREQSSSSAAG